eukprot:5342886-Heterocapsa_arctica.AAC.1
MVDVQSVTRLQKPRAVAKLLLLNVCPLSRRLDRRASRPGAHRPGRLAAVSRSRPRRVYLGNIMPQSCGLCRNLTLMQTQWRHIGIQAAQIDDPGT